MLMKKILLGGIAVGAFAMATSANALVTSATVGGVAITTASGPYTVASETILANLPQTGSATSITTVTATLGTATTPAPITLAAGAAAVTYQVTFNLGGSSTFKNSPAPSPTVAANTTGGPTTSVIYTTVSGTQIVALVTVTPAAGAATVLSGFTLTDTVTPNSAGLAQTSSLVATFANNTATPIDNGASNNLSLLTFGPSVNSGAPFATLGGTTTVPTVYASLATTPLFQAFNVSAVPNSATDMTSTGTGAAGFLYFDPILNTIASPAGVGFYSDLAGTKITSVASVIASESVAITGPNIASTGGLTATLGGVAPASISGNTATFTVNQTNVAAPGLEFVLTEPSTKVTILAGTYTAVVSYTPQSGFNGPTAATQPVGIVSLQGTSIIAPWVGDGTNGYQGVIRISNLSNAAIPAFTVTALNPVNALGSNPATCSFASPGTATTTVSSAMLNNCFGTYGNSDFRITFPVVSTSLAAKLRIINASTGVVTEQSLGSGQGLTFGTNTAGTIIQ
jgi:hypothetical protein